MALVIQGDNLSVLQALPTSSVNLIYTDPPFNTGHAQKSARNPKVAYVDSFQDYVGFLRPRLEQAYRVLKPNGSLYLHLDYREVHYVKVELDRIFGRNSFINEIIWAYDYGARSKSRWPAKHDNILFYAKDPNDYTFNFDAMDRIPYLAPSLVGPEKAARGKTPTSVWFNTIVHTTGKERTGYPTQKPLAIVRRVVKVSSNPGDLVLDFFAGSGTTGEACLETGRDFILVDENPQAIDVMRKRFGVNQVQFRTDDTKLDYAGRT